MTYDGSERRTERRRSGVDRRQSAEQLARVQRDVEIVRRIDAGISRLEIGKELNLTRERINQIYIRAKGLQRGRKQKNSPFAGLSGRARNTLLSENIASVEELCTLTEAQLLNIPNLGRATLDEIKEWLSDRNLSLAIWKP